MVGGTEDNTLSSAANSTIQGPMDLLLSLFCLNRRHQHREDEDEDDIVADATATTCAHHHPSLRSLYVPRKRCNVKRSSITVDDLVDALRQQDQPCSSSSSTLAMVRDERNRWERRIQERLTAVQRHLNEARQQQRQEQQQHECCENNMEPGLEHASSLSSFSSSSSLSSLSSRPRFSRLQREQRLPLHPMGRSCAVWPAAEKNEEALHLQQRAKLQMRNPKLDNKTHFKEDEDDDDDCGKTSTTMDESDLDSFLSSSIKTCESEPKDNAFPWLDDSSFWLLLE